MRAMRPKRLLNLMGDRLHALPLIVLYLTDGCNSRCLTCDIWRNPRKNMDMRLVDTIVDECASLGVSSVLLSGGEAMQHPQWDRIARRFREQGIYTMLLTNGLLLRKDAERLVGSVDEVIVSLDGGTATTYETIRGVDAFDLVLDGIRAVRALNIPVITRTTVQRLNYREMPQIIAVAHDAGVNRISFLAVDVDNPYAFGPRFVTDPDLVIMPPREDTAALSREDIDELEHILDDIAVTYADDFKNGLIGETPQKLRRILLEYFRTMHGQGKPLAPRCNAPHFSTVIEVDGTLRPCYFLPEYGKIEVNGGQLHEVINSGDARALRRAYRAGERQECLGCVCPLYKNPQALLTM